MAPMFLIKVALLSGDTNTILKVKQVLSESVAFEERCSINCYFQQDAEDITLFVIKKDIPAPHDV